MFSTLRIREVKKREGRRQLWALDSPLTYSQGINGHDGLRITVPVDFETDFASIPWPLWVIFSPTGPWQRAAVFHDYLCKHKKVSRFLADAVFRELMYRDDVPVVPRVIMYYAVRCYGALFVRKGKP